MEKFTIEDFMTSELGLSGNQLVLYAYLWEESKLGMVDVKNDYVKIAGLLNITVPTYYATINTLVVHGLVQKMGNGMLQVNRSK